MKEIIKLLDLLTYIGSFICMIIFAFRGSLIWVCVWGFIFIDEAVTIAIMYVKLKGDHHA